MSDHRFRAGVENVRSAADIVQVIGESVRLKPSGKDHVGLCPFHTEKTPSFRVDPTKQVFYCFGCSKGGDVFRFLMDLHGLEFKEAVWMLADRFGVPRPSFDGADAVRESREAQRRRRLLNVAVAAQHFFEECLASERADHVRAYLDRRGFSIEDAKRFGVGYAPNSWTAVLDRLHGRGATLQETIDAGIAVPKDGGARAYARFRGRITFPIRSAAGQIVSFGGRALSDENPPKYLNGPETPIYDKSRTLYRLSETAREMREAKRAVVVEGYFDALSLSAAGVPGVVAVCGTALGEAHARTLARLAETVVLVFDGDTAGRQATHRAIGPLLDAGLSVRVALLGEGVDPDDLAREGGREAVETLIADAKDLAGFLVDECRTRYDLSSVDQRVRALQSALAHVVRLDSPLARAHVAREIADGIGVENRLVRDELEQAARTRRPTLGPRAAAPRVREEPVSPAERLIVRHLVECARREPGRAGLLLDEIADEPIGPAARETLDRLRAILEQGGAGDPTPALEGAPRALRDAVLGSTFNGADAPTDDDFRHALDALRTLEARSRIGEIQRKIDEVEDPNQKARLLFEKLELARRLSTGAAPDDTRRPGEVPEGERDERLPDPASARRRSPAHGTRRRFPGPAKGDA